MIITASTTRYFFQSPPQNANTTRLISIPQNQLHPVPVPNSIVTSKPGKNANEAAINATKSRITANKAPPVPSDEELDDDEEDEYDGELDEELDDEVELSGKSVHVSE